MADKDNFIMLNRGDTYSFDMIAVHPADPDTNYILNDSDILYFLVTVPHGRFDDNNSVIIKKCFTKADINESGSFTITILSKETRDLKPGIYYYTFKLQQNITNLELDKYNFDIGDIITVVPRTKFILNE